MVDETILRNSLNLRNDPLRIRVDTQKNQTEDGEKSFHGVEVYSRYKLVLFGGHLRRPNPSLCTTLAPYRILGFK